MTKFKWTKDIEAELKKLVADKKSSSQIAKVIGTTKNAVIGKCRRLGLKLDSGIKPGAKRKEPTLKADKAVLAQIRKHTDKWGWGLEFDEIVEFTGFTPIIALQAVKSLLASRHINKTISHVGDHVFYNDAGIEQRGG